MVGMLRLSRRSLRGSPPARSHEGAVVLGALALTTVVALALRLDHLDSHSLWLDEVITAETVRFGTLGDALGWARIWVDNTPLMFVLTWLFAPLGGSEVAVRLPMVIAGTLTVPAIYALGQTIASRSVGLLAAVMLAVAPFAVYYSQEARAYAFVMLFTTLQMLFALRVALRPGRLDWLGLALFTGFSLHTSHFGLATTAAAFSWIYLTLWLDRPGPLAPPRGTAIGQTGPTGMSRARLASVALGLAVLSYLPVLPILVEFLGRGDLGFGRISTTGALSADVVVGLLGALDARGLALAFAAVGSLVALFRSIRRADRGALLLVMWVVLPVIGMLVLSRGQVQGILPRYFAFLYPAIVLLMAFGLAALARVIAAAVAWLLDRAVAADWTALRRIKSVVTVAIVTFGLAVLLADRYLSIMRAYETPKGENNRAAVEAIVAASRPGSTVMALGHNQEWLIETIGYYLWLQRSSVEMFEGARPGDLGLARIQRPGDVWGTRPRRLERATFRSTGRWLVPACRGTHDGPPSRRRVLSTRPVRAVGCLGHAVRSGSGWDGAAPPTPSAFAIRRSEHRAAAGNERR